ncbi:MAG: hypothetical protein WC882_05330 [Candidatus Gracilibacteria bacterium]|jgi:hypothetical protein
MSEIYKLEFIGARGQEGLLATPVRSLLPAMRGMPRDNRPALQGPSRLSLRNCPKDLLAPSPFIKI